MEQLLNERREIEEQYAQSLRDFVTNNWSKIHHAEGISSDIASQQSSLFQEFLQENASYAIQREQVCRQLAEDTKKLQITERKQGSKETRAVERRIEGTSGERTSRSKTSLRKIARHSRKQEKGKYSVVESADTDIKGSGAGNAGGGSNCGRSGRDSSSSMPRVLSYQKLSEDDIDDRIDLSGTPEENNVQHTSNNNNTSNSNSSNNSNNNNNSSSVQSSNSYVGGIFSKLRSRSCSRQSANIEQVEYNDVFHLSLEEEEVKEVECSLQKHELQHGQPATISKQQQEPISILISPQPQNCEPSHQSSPIPEPEQLHHCLTANKKRAMGEPHLVIPQRPSNPTPRASPRSSPRPSHRSSLRASPCNSLRTGPCGSPSPSLVPRVIPSATPNGSPNGSPSGSPSDPSYEDEDYFDDVRCVVLYEFVGGEEGELSVEAGEEVVVVEEESGASGWTRVMRVAEEGYVPTSYIQWM